MNVCQGFALLLVAVGGTAAADPLKIGFAAVDITPPVGYRMAGGYSEVLSTGVADRLFAKAIYFDQGSVSFALVVCDVCGLEQELVSEAVKQIGRRTGLPATRVSITATHTHAGPMHYDPILLKAYRDKIRATDDASDPKELGSYRKRFPTALAEAVVGAKAAAKDARLSSGSATVPGLAFNRRFHMSTGPVRTNPGKQNPGVVRPAGPSPTALPIVFVRDSSDQPMGCLTAFDMHTAVTGGRSFSACYPGHLQTTLRATFGPGFQSVFGEGCAGDVNHVRVATADKDPTAEQIGARLGAAVVAAVPTLRPIVPRLGVKVGAARLPLRPDRPDELAVSVDRLIGERAKTAEFLEQVEAYRVLLVHHMRTRSGDTYDSLVHAFRLADDVAIVTLPHEVFVELGDDIRRRSPFRQTLVISIANEVDCYVPTKPAYAEGGYEVTNSPFQPGAGELLADTAVTILKELHASP